MQSPFKFLDSFTKEDKDIFFGREQETEELYHKVFESKILLVYGISGTGKSSLIQCGLGNKFNESDWLPISIRRGSNINESLSKAVNSKQLSVVGNQSSVSSNQSATSNLKLQTSNLKRSLRSLYLDHFKPIYLIFDQFEELFIFGSQSEKEEFIQTVKKISESDLNVKFLFVIREEYLANITGFEKLIPEFLENRIRIEKMQRKNAVQCIEEPCRVYGIEVENGFSELLLDKLSPNSNEIELTYLQVFLDKIFRSITQSPTLSLSHPLAFPLSILSQLGDVRDLLGSFLEEQIASLDEPDSALAILKSFVSIKGTKRQINETEINEHCKTIGFNLNYETYKKQILHFVNIRILRDKDENNRYELRHDALAAKIYEKITLVEKELMEVRQFIENAYDNYQKRGVLLSKTDIEYLAVYKNKIILSQNYEQFYQTSLKKLKQQAKAVKLITLAAIFACVTMFGLIGWYFKKQFDFNDLQNEVFLTIIQDGDPIEQYKKAENVFDKQKTFTSTLAFYKSFFNVLDKFQNNGLSKLQNSIEGFSDAPFEMMNSLQADGKINSIKTEYPFVIYSPNEIKDANFSNNGSLIYATTIDGAVIVWDKKGTLVKLITNFSNNKSFKSVTKATSLRVSKDNDVEIENEIQKTVKDSSIVFSTISNDNNYIAILYSDSTVHIWNLYNDNHFSFKAYCNKLLNTHIIKFDSASTYIAALTPDNNITLYNLDGTIRQKLQFHTKTVYSLDISNSGNYIVSSATDTMLAVWKLDKATNEFKLFNSFKINAQITKYITSLEYQIDVNVIATSAVFSKNENYILATIHNSGFKIYNINGNMVYEDNISGECEFCFGKPINAEFLHNDSLIILNSIYKNKKVKFVFIYNSGFTIPYFEDIRNDIIYDNLTITYKNNFFAFNNNNNSQTEIRINPNYDNKFEKSNFFISLEGTNPVFSKGENHLMLIDKNIIRIYPVNVNDIKKIMSEYLKK